MAELLLEQQLKEAEREHNAHIADNYQRLMDEALSPVAPTLSPEYEKVISDTFAAPAREEAPVQNSVPESPVLTANAAARIADYVPIMPQEAEHHAADNFTAYVVEPAATSNDEAAPTPRTMDTILRPAAYEAAAAAVAPAATVATDAEEKVGFLSALSTRMKTALLCVTLAIIVAITLIIVNTAIIKSIDTDIASKRLELDRVTKAARQIESKLQDATDPDNVGEWAEENNMIFGQN